MITAVIITHNEERNIGRCLESLKGVADEVVVVDSGSTDGTEAICRRHGVHFVHHQWKDYSDQKNYANSLATGDWILSIDADEALSPRLRDSLLTLKQSGLNASTAYSFNRLTNYCGHWIRHCGWYPDRCTRLFRTGTMQWDGVVHEQLVGTDTNPTVSWIKGDLLHYSYYSVEEHASRNVKYAMLAAEKAHAAGRRSSTATIVLKTSWSFIRGYLLRGGFLDGAAGFTVCKVAAFYTMLKYTRLKELNMS